MVKLRRLLCIGAALVATVVVLGPTREASAHASLVSAVPAEGLTIFEPPETFQLEFNEPVSPLVMRLVQPDGKILPLTNARAKNKSVTIAAPPMPQLGSYVLSWRVISADGHPVGGVISFALGHPSAGVGIPPVEGALAVHLAIWVAQFILAIGLFVGVGGAAFAAWLAASRPAPGQTWLVAAIAAGAIAAATSLPLQGLDALALPLSQALRPSIWAAGFATSWGLSVVLALATLLAGFLALVLPNRLAARSAALLGIAGIGLTFVASGHATTMATSITVPSVFLHAICVALWVGALFPLTLAVRAGDRVALQRFSRFIPAPLLILIATGVALALVGFDRFDAFWTTDYGLVLAAKLAAVLAMLALAALNRYLLVPRLAVTGEQRLVTVIATEFVLAVLILGIVGLWRFTPPPRALAAAETSYIHLHGEPAMAEIELTPQRDRGAAVGIAVTDDDFRPVAAKEVVLVIWNAGAGIEPIRRNAKFEGGALWRIGGLHIPVAGVWRMRVEILIDDFHKVMLEDNVELPRAP
jgi:copper transport protein